MGEAKRKEGIAGPSISVLMPTRGRPAKAIRAISSLLDVKGVLPELLIGVDDDDLAFPTGSHVRAIVGPRLPTLGRCANRIAKEAKGDLLCWFGDDQTIGKDWTAPVRAAALRAPKATIFYLADPLHHGFASMPVVPRWIVDLVGFWWAPWFPFWFGDTWWDEIGELIGSKVGIEVGLRHPDGRGTTGGLRDLAFWVELFEALRPMRVQQAYAILREAQGAVTADDMRARNALCEARTAHLRSPEFLAQFPDVAPADERYAAAKADAEKLLAGMRAQENRRVAIAIPSQATWMASSGACVAGLAVFSATCNIETNIITVECSMISKGRNDLVRMALNIGVSHILFIDSDMIFPPDALARLLRQDKDIIGATYNKRFAPYESLGRLLAPRPTEEELRKGPTVEAEFLPGGFVLVRMDVFRKLQWPWFFETYRWPGETGTDMLREMLDNVFANRPPEHVLASIKDSALGQWADKMWKAEGVGEWMYVSEDISFFKKARRQGFRAWCDLGLTYQMKHIGSHHVTTMLPPEKGPEDVPGVMEQAAD